MPVLFENVPAAARKPRSQAVTIRHMDDAMRRIVAEIPCRKQFRAEQALAVLRWREHHEAANVAACKSDKFIVDQFRMPKDLVLCRAVNMLPQARRATRGRSLRCGHCRQCRFQRLPLLVAREVDQGFERLQIVRGQVCLMKLVRFIDGCGQ